MVGLALLAIVVFALICASQAPNAEHYYSAGSKDYQAVQPVSGPGAAQMSEKVALDAYEKLPLSFVSNQGQTDKAVRYYAQGAGYGFFFTPQGAMLSFGGGGSVSLRAGSPDERKRGPRRLREAPALVCPQRGPDR